MNRMNENESIQLVLQAIENEVGICEVIDRLSAICNAKANRYAQRGEDYDVDIVGAYRRVSRALDNLNII